MIRLSNSILFFASDFELVSEGKDCSGDEVFATNANTVESCAQYCKSIATMFVYGKNSKENECYCQTNTRSTGLCEWIDETNWDLYGIKYPGN